MFQRALSNLNRRLDIVLEEWNKDEAEAISMELHALEKEGADLPKFLDKKWQTLTERMQS